MGTKRDPSLLAKARQECWNIKFRDLQDALLLSDLPCLFPRFTEMSRAGAGHVQQNLLSNQQALG